MEGKRDEREDRWRVRVEEGGEEKMDGEGEEKRAGVGGGG